MTDLSQQTEALLKSLDQLHRDSQSCNVTLMICAALLLALVLIVAFKRK